MSIHLGGNIDFQALVKVGLPNAGNRWRDVRKVCSNIKLDTWNLITLIDSGQEINASFIWGWDKTPLAVMRAYWP